MLVVVVWGVYTLFFSSPRQAENVKSRKETETLNAFITRVAEKTKTGFSKEQSYILQKAQAAWKQDPLVQIQPRKTEDKDKVKKAPVLRSDILYTGFLQMGNKRLAIINGTEYKAGDNLEPGGFTIRRILPNQVVIAPPGKNKKTIILPLEETE